MPKVSIIVPTYNVEQFLCEAMNSIINQTLKDIEIICIDDGSTDNSGKILDEYASKDSRIKVIHKENGGYGKAMNVGLDNATGEYIGIVEPDDYVELDMFETLYSKAKISKVDFIKGNYVSFTTDNSSPEAFCESFPKNGIYDKVINPRKHPITFNGGASIWSAIYNHRFLKKNNIRFLETPGASFQDTSFWIEVLLNTNSGMFIKNAFNHYRVGNVNQSVRSNNKIFCICDELHSLEAHYAKNSTYMKIINAIKISKYTWNYCRLNEAGQNSFATVYIDELSDIIKQENYEKACVPDSVVRNCKRILFELNKIKVSVIIPVYNAEEYLKVCLESVINQTLKDIEIICVDDCSTDNSLEILNEYAHKDSRIKVLHLAKNKKQGRARNAGLDIASGKYIMFVDADDYLELNIVEDFLKNIQEFKTDIVISHIENFSQDEKNTGATQDFQNYYDKIKKDTGLYKFKKDFTAYRSGPVAKLFVKSIIDKYNIRFPENLINEDEAFHWIYFSLITSIYYSDIPYYKRRIHSASTMQLRDCYGIGAIDEFESIKYVFKFLKENKLLKKYKSILKSHYTSKKKEIKKRARGLDKKTLRKFEKDLAKFEMISGFGFYSSYIEKLFSIKNDGIRKVITIFGLKLKFKSKKLIKKQEEKKRNDKLNKALKSLQLQNEKIEMQSEKIKNLQNEISESKNRISKQQKLINEWNMQQNMLITQCNEFKAQQKMIQAKLLQIKEWQLDFYKLTPQKFPKSLSDSEVKLLCRKYNSSKNYLEFGSVGSTFLALMNSNTNIYSVESDPNWLDYLRSYNIIRTAEANNKLHFQHIDIGQTKEWGYPVNDDKKCNYPEYSNTIFEKIKDIDIDLVFIDGRFRVACTIAAILNCKPDTYFMIHDYTLREYYHVIEEFLDIVEQQDTLVVFKAKPNIQPNRLHEVYEKYKYIKE